MTGGGLPSGPEGRVVIILKVFVQSPWRRVGWVVDGQQARREQIHVMVEVGIVFDEAIKRGGG